MGVKRCQESEAKIAAGAKKVKTDPALEEVVKAVEAAARKNDLPDNCRAVLVALARGGLATPADERHALQATAVDKVGDTLGAQRDRLQQAITESEAKIAERDDVKNAIEGDRANARADLEAKSAAARIKKVALAEVTKEVLAAKKDQKDAEASQEAGDADRNETKVEKEHLEVTLAEHLTALRESACGEASVHLKAILALGSKLEMDDHLLSALPNAVLMEPTARRRFDTMSLQLVETMITEKINELEKELQAGAPEALSRAEFVASRREELARIKATLLSAAAEFRGTNAEHQESLNSVKEVDKREREFKRNAQALHQALNDCQVDLEIFQTGAWSSFETLRDRQSKQPDAATPSKADAEQSGVVEEPPKVAVGGH
jgi:hypothetical protein